MVVGQPHVEFLRWLATINFQGDQGEEDNEEDPDNIGVPLPMGEPQVGLDIIGESDDEGIEHDATDVSEEGLVREIYVKAIDIFRGQKMYCTTMSYIVVPGDRLYFLCYRCFEWFTANAASTSRYHYIETHRKSELEDAISHICDSCQLPLNQLKLTDCCILCNNVE